jgi:hypothetical protein
MLAIDSNQVKIIELEAEIEYLHNFQVKINAEIEIKFTPRKIISTLNKCCLLSKKLEKLTRLLLNWRRQLERKEKQLKRSYRKSCKKNNKRKTNQEK